MVGLISAREHIFYHTSEKERWLFPSASRRKAATVASRSVLLFGPNQRELLCLQAFQSYRGFTGGLAVVSQQASEIGIVIYDPIFTKLQGHRRLRAMRWVLIREKLDHTGQIQLRPVEIRGGLLVGVSKGLQEARTQGPRRNKIVYLQE
ncbi:hypothetical protein F1880_004506 [Penicillium rolfsii]|nr:hypothetical protein F1880_004506 [Penicillium rolfsii]